MSNQNTTPTNAQPGGVSDPNDPGLTPDPIDDAEVAAAVDSYSRDEAEANAEQDADGIKPQVIAEDARGRIAREFQDDRRKKLEEERAGGGLDGDAALREQLKLTNVMTGANVRNEDGSPESEAQSREREGRERYKDPETGRFISKAEAEERGLAGGDQLVTEPTQGQQSAAPGQETIRVKVYGREYDVPRNDDRWFTEGATDEQIRRIAQKELASEAKLAAANARTGDPNQLQDQVAQPTATPANQRGAQAAQPQGPGPQTTVSRDKIANIVDRIQNGTHEDGVEALSELVNLTAGPRDIQSEVRQVLTNDKIQSESDQAAESFARDNADLLEKPLLGKYVLDRVHENMLAHMRSLGTVDEALLGPIKGNGPLIARVYNVLRNDGVPLKTHSELLDEAAGQIRGTFNLPKPNAPRQQSVVANQGQVETRTEAKRQMQPQPRSAGVRSQPAPQGPKPLTREEYIQAEKRRRSGAAA
jgi:hypothetical protein